MCGDDDNAADSPDAGTGSGSPAAISRAAEAAFAGWEASNRVTGQRFVAAHELMVECVAHPDCWSDPDRPGFSVVDAEVMAASHLVRMFPISTFKAKSLLSFAADLHFRYPAILEAMLQGRMDEVAARALGEQMSHVDESVLDQVQRAVVEDYLAAIAAGERPGTGTVRKRADELITAHDRNAVRERLADAGRERGATISKARDGMARLYALLHADEAAVLAEALDQKVAADKAAEQDAADRAAATTDPDTDANADQPGSDGGPDFGPDSGDELYSVAQRRADALLSLICGDAEPDSDAATSGDTDTDTDTDADADSETADATAAASDAAAHAGSAASGSAAGSGRAGRAFGSGVTLRPKVTVIAPGGAGRWADRARVEFARTGEAAVQALLEMLASSDGASLQCIDPAQGADDDAEAALRYRPGTALANRIRLRDGTCRHPGCSAPVEVCDLDHVVPFDHDNPAAGGQTVESNLVGLCREHHLFKTFNDWNYSLEPDGTLVITTPEGDTMLTRPDGPLAAYRREQARAESKAWERQQHRSPDPGRISANGGVDPNDYVSQSSWARRDARRKARRAKQRATNAANRAANAKREARAKRQTRDEELSRQDGGLGLGFLPVVVSTRPDVFDLPAHRDTRWWRNNHHRYPSPADKADHSEIEHALRAVLGDLLDPPPPF